MRVRIVTHGHLRQLCPEEYSFEAKTAWEALRAFASQAPSLRRTPRGKEILVTVVGYNTLDSLHSPLQEETLHITPRFIGGKSSGGFIKIVIGVALIAVSILCPPAGAAGLAAGAASATAAGLTIAGTFISASQILLSGILLLAGGLLELMSPAPKMDTGVDTGPGDPPASRYLGAPGNTVSLGTRIPLGFGRHRVGGHYLSFDIQAKDVLSGANYSTSGVDSGTG